MRADLKTRFIIIIISGMHRYSDLRRYSDCLSLTGAFLNTTKIALDLTLKLN